MSVILKVRDLPLGQRGEYSLNPLLRKDPSPAVGRYELLTIYLSVF